MIYVTQSWDDGVTDDVRLIDLLRRYKAKGTFNIIAGGHKEERFSSGWRFEGKEVFSLALRELPELYEGFEVASHSVTHPHLEKIEPEKMVWEVSESWKRLNDIFQRDVRGFCYPFATFNQAVKDAVRNEGYVYARAAARVAEVFPPADAMELNITTWFSDANFWTEFERVKKAGGTFHFMGHSYEFLNEAMWTEFEAKLARLSADPDVVWKTNLELFE